MKKKITRTIVACISSMSFLCCNSASLTSGTTPLQAQSRLKPINDEVILSVFDAQQELWYGVRELLDGESVDEVERSLCAAYARRGGAAGTASTAAGRRIRFVECRTAGTGDQVTINFALATGGPDTRAFELTYWQGGRPAQGSSPTATLVQSGAGFGENDFYEIRARAAEGRPYRYRETSGSPSPETTRQAAGALRDTFAQVARLPAPSPAEIDEAAAAVAASHATLFVPQSLFPHNLFSEIKGGSSSLLAGRLRMYRDLSHLVRMVRDQDAACILLVKPRNERDSIHELRRALGANPGLAAARFIAIRPPDPALNDVDTVSDSYRRIFALMSLLRVIDEEDLAAQSSVYVVLRYLLHALIPSSASVEQYLLDEARRRDSREAFLAHLKRVMRVVLFWHPSSPYSMREVADVACTVWR